MKFEIANGFTLVHRESTETISTYELDDLILQRAAVQARLDAETDRSRTELARIEDLIAQCTVLGVASRAVVARQAVQDAEAALVETAPVETPPVQEIPSV